MTDRWTEVARRAWGISALCVALLGCPRSNPSYCEEDDSCPTGQTCQLPAHVCRSGADGGEWDGGDPDGGAAMPADGGRVDLARPADAAVPPDLAAARGWTVDYPTPGAMNALCVRGQELFAAGANGVVLHRTAQGQWRTETTGTTQALLGLWCDPSPAGGVWAVGAGGTILFWNGQTFVGAASGTSDVLYGVYGVPDASGAWVLAVGDYCTVVRKPKGAQLAFSKAAKPNCMDRLLAVDGNGANDIWAVGFPGIVAHYNDGAMLWELPSYGQGVDVSGVRALGTDQVYVGRSSARVERWSNNNSWIVFARLDNMAVSSLWASSSTDLWIGGVSAIWRLDTVANGWEAQTLPANASGPYRALVRDGSGVLWAASGRGILRLGP